MHNPLQLLKEALAGTAANGAKNLGHQSPQQANNLTTLPACIYPAEKLRTSLFETSLCMHCPPCTCIFIDAAYLFRMLSSECSPVIAAQELYGGTAAGQLLSAFSRLFTYYLSWHGFTCGFDDLLLVREAGEAQSTATWIHNCHLFLTQALCDPTSLNLLWMAEQACF